MITRHGCSVETAHVLAALEFGLEACSLHGLNQLLVALNRVLVLLDDESVFHGLTLRR